MKYYCTSNKKWSLLVFIPFVISTFFVLVSPARATESCTCFCATTNGAQTLSSATNAQQCMEKCPTEKNGQMLVCASGPDEYPSRDPWCFASENICQKYDGKLDTAYQPPQCLQGSFFCYPDPDSPNWKDTELSVSIGGVKTVKDLGEYIQLVYTWLLGSMGFIVIILIMFNGAKYVLSAGVAEAKNSIEGIKKAVTGLILLSCVAFLLQTVNPYLIRLAMPRLPLIQSVDLVGEGSCEYLKGTLHDGKDYLKVNGAFSDSPFVGKSYTLGNPPAGGLVCGAITEVVKDSDGQPALEGTTCQFEYCEEEGTRCFGRGAQAKCLSCKDIIPENIADTGVSPSAATCSNLTTPDVFDGNGDLVTKNYCFYTQDPGLVLSNLEVAGGTAITAGAALAATVFPPVGAAMVGGVLVSNVADIYKGTCAGLSLDCTKITSCSAYNGGDVEVYTGETDNELNDVGSGWLAGTVNMEYICSNDPCGAAVKDGDPNCVYSQSSNRCYESQAAIDLSEEIDAAQPLPGA